MITIIILLLIMIMLYVLMCRVDTIWYFLKHGHEKYNKDFRKYIK